MLKASYLPKANRDCLIVAELERCNHMQEKKNENYDSNKSYLQWSHATHSELV